MNRIHWKIGVSELEENRIAHEAASEAKEHGCLTLGNHIFRVGFNGHPEDGICSFYAESAQLAQGRFFLAAELPDYREDWFVFMPSACYDGNRRDAH